jgi:metallophosphoesterase (TIGR00282 family)
MNILYIGDVMGELGLQMVEQTLPKLQKFDLVIAQAENTSDGRGITPEDFTRLKKAGVDFCTGGNWSLYRQEIVSSMNDPLQPIIRPANYPEGTPGLGYKYVAAKQGKVLVISLLGKVVGRDAEKEMDNPLHVVDKILEQEKGIAKVATVVNFHGDYSSEKVVIGHYLDGRVTAVVGDHWHVPTADAGLLPKRTAHITDVGMCGSLDSSLGVTLSTIITRWRDGQQNRNQLETTGRRQFCAVHITADEATGLAIDIKQIRLVVA